MKRIHGGAPAIPAGYTHESFIDFSASINPLGPPSWFRQLVNRNLETLVHYPDPDCRGFREAAGRLHGVRSECIMAANGASEIIFALPRFDRFDAGLIPVPSYGDYRYASEAAGVPVTTVPLDRADGFRLDENTLSAMLQERRDERQLVWIGQPNNPTGRALSSSAVQELCAANPGHLFVVDESFADFLEDYTSCADNCPANCVVLRSLTKFYGVPGLRIGYAVSSPDLAARITDVLPTWSVNTLAQLFGERALGDTEYQGLSRESMSRERTRLGSRLSAMPGIEVCGGEANFLLLHSSAIPARAIGDALRKTGIAIRTCDDFEGLDEGHFRIAVRAGRENDRFIDALAGILAGTLAGARVGAGGDARGSTQPRKAATMRNKAARLMIQGTASNAGKSVLATAFCRMLLQDGIKVAPFKAQNMSLNSFVTADGGEMGRAQVVQAQACRIDPDVRMNPVLLKPSSQTGSQVILCGKPIAFMEAKKYHTDKTALFDEVTRCFDELSTEYDAVVLEGAGSPGEVNLKKYDIVNMKMAEYAQAPVLLAGDIDRGGVFASFIGTFDVLDEWERRLVKGFLINKFRGDPDLLGSATDYTYDYTGRPTLGIVPMINNLGIPDEDSVSFKQEMGADTVAKDEDRILIGLVDLPHISNFTDFDPLRNEPDVEVRIVRTAEALGSCDVVIIPGSKNVFADLSYLKDNGIASRIASMADSCEIIGVCGGYQMLGRVLSDPSGIETTDGSADGIGLLNLETVLGDEKILKQVRGVHIATDVDLVGYEIHHGRTVFSDVEPWIEREDGEVLGVRRLNVYGTYLHGLFDSDRFRRWYIDSIRAKRGLSPLGHSGYVHDVEAAIDRLAEVVRRHVDLDAVYSIMGL